jgi:hypothetical protein
MGLTKIMDRCSYLKDKSFFQAYFFARSYRMGKFQTGKRANSIQIFVYTVTQFCPVN